MARPVRALGSGAQHHRGAGAAGVSGHGAYKEAARPSSTLGLPLNDPLAVRQKAALELCAMLRPVAVRHASHADARQEATPSPDKTGVRLFPGARPRPCRGIFLRASFPLAYRTALIAHVNNPLTRRVWAYGSRSAFYYIILCRLAI